MASQLKFFSRRSPVVCTHGCVASSQMLATNIGLDTLKNGGKAVDAAGAVAAALSVTEPVSSGIGGDCYCDADTKHVRGLNGSGRSPRALTVELLKEQGFDEANPLPPLHARNITVPGAAACWYDAVSLYGSKKLSIGQLLQPAIELAEQGFPVAEITAYHWKCDAHILQSLGNKHGKELLIDGQAPLHGQVFSNPFLASTFKELAGSGKKGFYEGRIAAAIVETVQRRGGVMDLEDIKSHTTDEDKPIFTNYRGVNVWETPPNGQGITALMTLNILENVDVKEMGHNTADSLHVLIEAMKLSFTDAFSFCAGPDEALVPTKELLSKTYAKERSRLINLQRASDKFSSENVLPLGTDTVSFIVVDPRGNACSFINSNYMGFGPGLVPDGCGFTLHNRGANFSLSSSHLNCLAPGKRPYHTIMPALATAADSEELLCSFGVMGGFTQPQGHAQVLLNMLVFGMNPQQALDAARFCLNYSKEEGRWHLSLEDGVSRAVAEEDLRARGHWSRWPISGHNRSLFGCGQIIAKGDWWQSWGSASSKHLQTVLWAGSDPRGDGCAMGY
nr:PREDICTED: LOW QUALITY PROTEIN: gamma-glutamyltranspeptidase 2-like [Struthio camelus australis]